MPLCSECHSNFIPSEYLYYCDACGSQLERRYDELQEFRQGVLTMSELAGRIAFQWQGKPEPVWRIG